MSNFKITYIPVHCTYYTSTVYNMSMEIKRKSLIKDKNQHKILCLGPI